MVLIVLRKVKTAQNGSALLGCTKANGSTSRTSRHVTAALDTYDVEEAVVSCIGLSDQCNQQQIMVKIRDIFDVNLIIELFNSV